LTCLSGERSKGCRRSTRAPEARVRLVPEIVRLRVNVQQTELMVRGTATLLDSLRNDLGLTGTKRGCDVGECGTCMVLLNGEPTNACLVFTGELEGADVVTVEGLACGNALHPLQQAFIDRAAAQCGFCTPGFLITAAALLRSNAHPTEEEVREALAGNLCRCTGYRSIVEAVLLAASRA
jgi:carbon-monoxide dehydrogenase small subunit